MRDIIYNAYIPHGIYFLWIISSIINISHVLYTMHIYYMENIIYMHCIFSN